MAAPDPPGPEAPFEQVLEWLGKDLEAGPERLAAEWDVEAADLVRNLVARAGGAPPSLVRRSERQWGAFDAVVAAALAILLALAGWAAWTLSHPAAPGEESPITRLLGGISAVVNDTDLVGRTLLALPIEPAGFGLLGNLPTRLAAAVVPAPPENGSAPRPVLRLDDLLVLHAEATDRGVAVVVAVPEAEVPGLLAALPGAEVHLLRPPPPPPPTPPPHGTP